MHGLSSILQYYFQEITIIYIDLTCIKWLNGSYHKEADCAGKLERGGALN